MNRRNFTKLISLFAVLFPFLKWKKQGTEHRHYSGIRFVEDPKHPVLSENINPNTTKRLESLQRWAIENRIPPIKDPFTGEEYFILQIPGQRIRKTIS